MKILKSVIRNTVGVILCGFVCLSLPAQTIITFDVPSARETYPVFINNSGTVTGNYIVDPDSKPQGFVRSASGDITTFDPPGSRGTTPTSINSGGTVAGYFTDDSMNHGFLRAPDGTITVFDPPGSVNTVVTSNIDESGGLAGVYISANEFLGFYRTGAGEYTTLSLGPSTHGGDLYPQTYSVNNVGTLAGTVGHYSVLLSFGLSSRGGYPYPQTYGPNDAGTLLEGFVRDAGGPYTFFEVPGAAITSPVSINASGTTTGSSQTEPSALSVAFVRSPSGEFTTFQVDGLGTYPASINSSGVVIGIYGPQLTGGFIRNAAGDVTTLQPNGAAAAQPVSINDYGTITGSFEVTSGGFPHGFVWMP